MTKLTILVFFLFLSGGVYAQPLADSNTIDISKIEESQLIIDKCQVYIDTTGNAKPGKILGSDWKNLAEYNTRQYIPNSWITNPVFLKFTLENSHDTLIKIHFIASNYIRSMYIFKLQPNQQFEEVKDESRLDGFQPIALGGRTKQVYIVKFHFTKKQFNLCRPQLVNNEYLIKFQHLRYFKNAAEPAVGYLLSGIMLMMIFFTGSNFLLSKKREFLYNCLFSTCMFGLVFLNTYLERRGGILSSLFFEYFAFLLLATGTVFYLAFIRRFLETGEYYPLLNKIFLIEEKFLILVILSFTIIVFFTNNFALQKTIENGMKLIVLAIGAFFIIFAITKKNELLNYLAIGNGILIFFSIISFMLILIPTRNSSILTSSMLYYELGLVGELIFFLLGLTYKNRIELIGKIKEQEALKLRAEKQSFENKLALLNAQQKERNRISADMHDNLGAGVTAIRLYSELAKKRIGKNTIPELEKISASANDLLDNMNAIIWTMSSTNDSLGNMIGYIRSYAQEYFENTGINCQIQIEEDIPHIAVNGDIRRNVFMVVKEALNNILKHSGATEVNITLKQERNGLSLYIHDNGKGIDFENLRKFGNGLNNMRKRMEECQILFKIENNNGTLITLHTRVAF